MDIYMVGVYKQRNKIVGFKMLDPNANDASKQVMDVEYNKVIGVLQSKSANIVNLRLENGKLKGYNGSIDRYGVIGKSQALVILRKAVDNNDNMLGYICSDCNGNMRLLSENQVIEFANKIALANGKVVTDASGKSYVSAIEGTYQIYKKAGQKPAQQQPQSKQQPQTNQSQEEVRKHTNGIDAETTDIIGRLKEYKGYDGSYQAKVVGTIQKLNRCTPKQKACLQKILKELETKNAPKNVASQQPAQKVEKPATTNNVQTPSNNSNTNIEKEQRVADLFIVEIMNNQLYIKGLKDTSHNKEVNMIIPNTLEYQGKTYPVSGISAYAFKGTNIRRLVVGPNVVDIGQSAFADCSVLTEVDLSASRIPHIAMNCFNGCQSLKSAKIGNMVQRIHEAAFMGCKLLTEIDLPDSTDTIARIAFLNCENLKTVRSKVTTINDSAFRDCYKLKEFDFSHVISVGSHAFRNTAFDKLVLPGNITSIGAKAFSDIAELSEVELQDGIEVLGEYCFAKSKKDKMTSATTVRKFTPINRILTCKSIKEIGRDAFRHATLVEVYTGSVAESHCIGFDVPYVRLDASTVDNSTRVRIKSEVLDSNPMVTLWTMIKETTEGASNPEIELNTAKLVDIPFEKQNFDFFHIPETTVKVKPHAKFIGLVNYLQDVSDLYTTPMAPSVLRLQKTYNVMSHEIYNDNCNRVYKVMYSLMDTLEEGGFIMVIMDNHLRFVAELNIATDVSMSSNVDTDQNIPIKKFIHAGDKIGKTSTISGHNGVVIIDGDKCNVGEAFFNVISDHCIEIIPQRKDSIWYVPAVGLALKLHDKREWEKDNYSQSGKKIARNSQDCLNVLEVLSYEDLINASAKYRKHTTDSNKFFKTLTSMTDKEVQGRIGMLANVEEEKEAQLFQVSKEFIKRLEILGKSLDTATPNDLTIELFNEISQSYWMIEKDQNWLRLTGKKSLNRTNEYTIDGYKLVEYKSNQVVKFSNPYMNGQKGAFVFTLMKNGRIYGVYASRHSMQQITKKLVKLTQMKPSTVPIALMTDAYNIDICEHDLFYNFYDVLYSKDGWSFKNYIQGYNRGIWNLNADFHIAMYKPTGIFYLTMEAYVGTGDGTRGRRTMPVLPIGNMDRALMIATTTNSKNKNSKLLEELMVLATAVILRSNGSSATLSFKFDNEVDINAYFKARELAIQGVKDIDVYKQLINDRVVYMLGTVHTGVLQREFSNSGIDVEVDTSDIELYEEPEDTYEDDIEVDLDIDIDTPEDEYIDDEDEDFEFDLDEDEDDDSTSSSISDADARELQKQLEAAGHKLSLAQIKIMMLQQMK